MEGTSSFGESNVKLLQLMLPVVTDSQPETVFYILVLWKRSEGNLHFYYLLVTVSAERQWIIRRAK